MVWDGDFYEPLGLCQGFLRVDWFYNFQVMVPLKFSGWIKPPGCFFPHKNVYPTYQTRSRRTPRASRVRVRNPSVGCHNWEPLGFFGVKLTAGYGRVSNGSPNNGIPRNPKQQPCINGWKWWFPTIFYIKIWFIIQLKQPFLNGCSEFQVFIPRCSIFLAPSRKLTWPYWNIPHLKTLFLGLLNGTWGDLSMSC